VKEFKRTVGSSSRFKGHFKGRLSFSSEKEFRSLASLAVWLDQEEDSVKMVPEEYKCTVSAN
jgi:hypothetical protein